MFRVLQEDKVDDDVKSLSNIAVMVRKDSMN